MKAEDLELQELVTFQDGNINLYGRRLVLHSIHAFGQFRQDLIEMLGTDDARRVFTRFGFFWGQTDAGAMTRVLEWDDPSELLRAGFRLQAMEGITRPEIKAMKIDPVKGLFNVEILWHNTGEAEEHLTELGWATYPICWKLVGYASGYATFCMGKNIYFKEIRCTATGEDVCYAVGKDLDSWGEEIVPLLPYFQAEDIKGKVMELTMELQKKTRELAEQRKQLGLPGKSKPSFFIEGRSKALEDILSLATRVAQYDSSVLITGETGVGKELLARFIHSNSHRKEGPFVAVNCGALPETLLESELFGHKKGSFTGAIENRIGLFEQAAGGTIFLDEIGDISQGMQLKILRVLQEKEVLRIGESKPRKIAIRIITATNKNLDRAVSDGTFREDLLYRIKVIEICIPPLRDRKEDILPLARHLVGKLSRQMTLPDLHMDSRCVDYFHSYKWPGNVREMENALERAAIMSEEGLIVPEHLPPSLLGVHPSPYFEDDSNSKTLAQIEREYIKAVLRSTDGNRTRAAKILGIGTATLWRKLKSFS